MSQEIQSEEVLDQAWRNVELILKVQSISRDFSEESKPQIEIQLKERYESAFADAREHGKSEQEAHMLAMGCLDNDALLKRELNRKFLTEQEGAFAGLPQLVFHCGYLQAKISAAISFGLFWRQFELGVRPPGATASGFFCGTLAALCVLAVALTLFALRSTKVRNVRRTVVLSFLGGIVWVLFYMGTLYFFGGWKPALFILLPSFVQTAVLLIVCQRVYRKTGA